MGDINAKLLQKIGELTLYTIEEQNLIEEKVKIIKQIQKKKNETMKICKTIITLMSCSISLIGISQTPAGNNQEIQFNNNGVFGASSYLKWDGTNLRFLNLGTYSAKLYFMSET
ncbi:MAG TPA: hypothetical protein VF985_06650, partial [Mariniflexile sp.]